MLLIQFDGTEQAYHLMRNNPTTGYAERKTVHGSEITYLIPDDNAVNAVLEMARQVPNQYHVVPNPRPRGRQTWGRMVL